MLFELIQRKCASVRIRILNAFLKQYDTIYPNKEWKREATNRFKDMNK
jgi:hypothetical protein